MPSAIGLLGVAFVLLKILGVEPVAQWSWWWVTAPFWIPLLIYVLVVSYEVCRGR